MPAPGGCGHYAPNRDYAGESQALKAARLAATEEDKLRREETIADIENRLGKLCELCGERNLDTRVFGGSLAYIACADVSACEEVRKANLKKGFL